MSPRSEANRRRAGSRGVPRGDLPSRAVSATRQIAHRAGLPFVARRPDKPYRARPLCVPRGPGDFLLATNRPSFAAVSSGDELRGRGCAAGWSRPFIIGRTPSESEAQNWKKASRSPILAPLLLELPLHEQAPTAELSDFERAAPKVGGGYMSALGSDYGTAASVGRPLSD
ncbi:hypothetical protein MTO96_013478 [Rhipicephalus appendiculatus]